jgi:phosphate starvation-inducible PhoH-like protein
MGKNKNKNRKFQEDNEFNKIMANNGEWELQVTKKEIERLIPNNITVKAKNDKQIKLINSIRNNEITICAGPAGTGKTFVSVAYALALLRKMQNRFKKIYLVKSVTTLKGEEIGFLKGDFKEKIEPFMWSYFINMEKIIKKNSITQLLESDIIRPFPLAYMRGASLDNCIIIADETQNITMDNARTLLTRIGNNSKLILLGDINQIDMKNKEESSLEKLLELFQNENKFGVINMGMEDTNVRNPLITTIEEKFSNYYESNEK